MKLSNSPQEEPGKILIVDDVPGNLLLLSNTLTQQGYSVRCAKNGKMALIGIQHELPDLIMLDIQMPDMDGYEICRTLKNDPKTGAIPIIFLSASNEVEEKLKAFEVGGVDYIIKPFEISEVLARVKTQISLLRTRDFADQLLVKQHVANQQLEASNQKLKKAMTVLKQTQAQMVQSEKMSALGQMVAGVAHEINNPVNFIHGNIPHLENYIHGLLDLINLYQAQYPQSPPVIEDKVEEIELDFISQDLPKLLQSMEVGSNRIHEIISSLRQFSRLDESSFKAVDLHEGIESTLLILQHRLKPQPDRPAIRILKQYGQELPPVECHPGQINQVLMNFLVNAIDALESSIVAAEAGDREAASPTIWITTEVAVAGYMRVTIADNGPGIPAEYQSRLFDPFFTSKPIGKGTGLGLSISYNIIQAIHKGKIWFESAAGEGTKFMFEIPVETALETDEADHDSEALNEDEVSSEIMAQLLA